MCTLLYQTNIATHAWSYKTYSYEMGPASNQSIHKMVIPRTCKRSMFQSHTLMVCSHSMLSQSEMKI
jgi:hypothetical protein